MLLITCDRVRSFPCEKPGCPKIYGRKADLERHFQSKHIPNAEKLICSPVVDRVSKAVNKASRNSIHGPFLVSREDHLAVCYPDTMLVLDEGLAGVHSPEAGFFRSEGINCNILT